MSKSLIRKAPKRPGPIIELLWLDSVGNGGWGSPENHKATASEILHRSVGYLVDETAISVTIIQSVGGVGNYDHSMTIPKVALIRRSRRPDPLPSS